MRKEQTAIAGNTRGPSGERKGLAVEFCDLAMARLLFAIPSSGGLSLVRYGHPGHVILTLSWEKAQSLSLHAFDFVVVRQGLRGQSEIRKAEKDFS